MSEVVLLGHAINAGEVMSRARMLDRLRLGDAIFRALTKAAAVGVLIRHPRPRNGFHADDFTALQRTITTE